IGKNTRWFYTSALSFSLPDYFQMLSDAENNIVVSLQMLKIILW
ncbi:hypothetical protein LTSESEN_4878, partial [Salmonella enterica subsp. enterica serovar Senftenberg str. A4-543]